MVGKLRSKWIGHFVVTNIFPHGAVETKSAAHASLSRYHPSIAAYLRKLHDPKSLALPNYREVTASVWGSVRSDQGDAGARRKRLSEIYWVTVLGGVRENDDESPTAKVEGKWKWSDLWLRTRRFYGSVADRERRCGSCAYGEDGGDGKCEMNGRLDFLVWFGGGVKREGGVRLIWGRR
ncbi:hypothetical protein KIW84_030698 [Lathyrus oleraceus]|uniref:Uncharacterized protein n=1 Tax=Pisum sativum TaxID=3888 RepID=A0A9D5AUB0_PEA|nr:hypothetical protein KIW84_030698 [Pisum sativum]